MLKIPPGDAGGAGQRGTVAEGDLAGHHTRHPAHRSALQQLPAVHRRQPQQLQQPAAAGNIGPFVPTADFETGLFSIFTAGNFGSDIAFWVDDDISVSGANANGGLGEAYLKFVNIGRLMKLPENSLNLRVGQIELDIPFTQSKSIWISPYDIYTPGQYRRGESGVQPAVRQQPVHPGRIRRKALSSAADGTPVATTTRLPSSTRTPAAWDRTRTRAVRTFRRPRAATTAGVGIASDANFKDIYASFNYRFNLEKDKESRNAIQAAGPSGPRDHTYLNLGTYYFYGRSVQRLSGATLRRYAGRAHRARAVLPCRRQLHLQLSQPADQRPVHVRPRLQPAADRLDRRADSAAGERHRRRWVSFTDRRQPSAAASWMPNGWPIRGCT